MNWKVGGEKNFNIALALLGNKDQVRVSLIWEGCRRCPQTPNSGFPVLSGQLQPLQQDPHTFPYNKACRRLPLLPQYSKISFISIQPYFEKFQI